VAIIPSFYFWPPRIGLILKSLLCLFAKAIDSPIKNFEVNRIITPVP
jgi:hypothetical protein